jgi:hypothetical protein
MSWNTSPLSLLNTYRVSHHLSTPAAFTSPLNQALLVNPGIGRQSPTMARRKDKRRVSKEQLATNVRKHFNGAAVNEIDVVVELVYKSRNKGKLLAGYYLLRSATLTSCRQGIPHALSAWHHQEVMTNHLYLPARTSPLHPDTTNTTQHSLTYSFLHHTTSHITPPHTTRLCTFTFTCTRHRRLSSLCCITTKHSNCTYRLTDDMGEIIP